jgi:hypothetical protein
MRAPAHLAWMAIPDAKSSMMSMSSMSSEDGSEDCSEDCLSYDSDQIDDGGGCMGDGEEVQEKVPY